MVEPGHVTGTESPGNPSLVTSSPWPGSPYGAPVLDDAAAIAEPDVYVPVMLSAGDVAHYVASFDDGQTWQPACGAGVELYLSPADPDRVSACPQCQTWARRALSKVN